VFVFVGNFFGYDLSDEGLAALGFAPGQKLGIPFTHYQFLIQKLFPNGLGFIVARQIRWIIVIISSSLLLLSVYKSKFNKHFSYFALLIGATTLISISTGIRVLSYNGLNQVIVTLYVASLVQYLNSVIYNRSKHGILWIFVSAFFVGLTYLVRLPSFFLYLFIQVLVVLFINRANRKRTALHLFAFFLFIFLVLTFLSFEVVPFGKVMSDALLNDQLTPNSSKGHGMALVVEYLFNFTRTLTVLFFTSISYYALQKYFNRIEVKKIVLLLNIILFFIILFVVTTYPISISAFAILFFFILFVTFYAKRVKAIDFLKESDELFLAFLFPAIAISSTIGSNVWIVNLLLFYLSIWMVGSLFFISRNNLRQFKTISYLMVLLAVLKVFYTGFINPHRQGSLLSGFKLYKTETRGVVFLDKEMYEYVDMVRSYLKEKNLYGRKIIAISRLPGLVDLLDSTMPGMVLFTEADWKVYCESLKNDSPEGAVVIFRGLIPQGLHDCLAVNEIDLDNNYILDKTIEYGYSKYQIPTNIYIQVSPSQQDAELL